MSGRLRAKGGTLSAARGTLFLMNRAPTAAFTVTRQDLKVLFDATASTDPDGLIHTYSWDFGDGQTDFGSQLDHTYSAPGNYTVTLTVSDPQGLEDSFSRVVSVTLPDVTPPLPTQNFRATESGTTTVGGVTTAWVKLEWDAPIDPDPGTGAIVSGCSSGRMEKATGSSGSFSYMAQPKASVLSYTVTGLTVRQLYRFRKRESDNAGNSSAYTTISHLAGADKPTVDFTFSSNERVLSTVGTAADTDGTIVERVWDFGDGTVETYTGTAGANATHTYATNGTYLVTHTVKDNDGLTATISKQVTVNGPTLVMSDDFARTSTTIPGTAPTGQSWVNNDAANPFGTDGTHLYSVNLAAASRTQVNVGDKEQRIQCVPKFLASFDVIARYANSNTFYYVTFGATGNIVANRRWNAQNRTPTPRIVAPATTAPPTSAPANTWKAGDVVQVEARSDPDTTDAANPVRIIVRVNGVVVLDFVDLNGTSTPAGTFAGYRHNTASVDQRITTWRVSTFAPPVVNQPPIASFTTTVDKLSVSANASASADPEGSSLLYSWNWGDGQTETGLSIPTRTHLYGAAGTYTVTLTVVDNANKSATTTKSVTVSEDAVPDVITDPDNVSVFPDPTISNRLVTLDGNTSDRAATGYTIQWGDGTSSSSTSAPPTTHTHIYQSAGKFIVTLIVTKGGVAYTSSRAVQINSTPVATTRPVVWPVPKATLAGKLPYAGPDTSSGEWVEWTPTSASRRAPNTDKNLIISGKLIDWVGSPQLDIPRTVDPLTGKLPHLVIIGCEFRAGLPVESTPTAYQQAIKLSSWSPKGNTPLERPGMVYLEGNVFLPHESLRTGPGKLDWVDGHVTGKYWERLTYSTVNVPNIRWIEQNNFTYGCIHTRPAGGGHTGGDGGSQISSPIYEDIALYQNELWDLSYQGYYLEPWDSSTWRMRDENGAAINVGDVFTDRLILAGPRDRGTSFPWYEEDQYSGEPGQSTDTTGTTSSIRKFFFGDEVYAVSNLSNQDRMWHPDYLKFSSNFKVRKWGDASRPVPAGWLNPDNLGRNYVSPGYNETKFPV